MTRKVTLACTQFACSWDKEGNLVRPFGSHICL